MLTQRSLDNVRSSRPYRLPRRTLRRSIACVALVSIALVSPLLVTRVAAQIDLSAFPILAEFDDILDGALGDIDGDGDTDAVVTSRTTVHVLRNTGDAKLHELSRIDMPGDPLFPRLIDLDRDGILDLLYTRLSSVRVHRGVGGGIFEPDRGYPCGFTPTHVLVADLDEDGADDLVVGRGSSIRTLFGDGSGGFGEPIPFATPAPIGPMAAIDIDRDGIRDLLYCSGDESAIIFLLANGNGAYESDAMPLAPNKPTDLLAVDVNNDAVSDLVFPIAGTGYLATLVNTGNRFLDLRVSATNNLKDFLVAGDYDEDGRLDVMAVERNVRRVALHVGNGTGYFSPRVHLAVPRPCSAATDDFNGDGHLDIAVSHDLNPQVTVFLGSGDGLFSDPVAVEVHAPTVGIDTGDFDGDGNCDIVVTHPDDSVSLLGGIGGGSFVLASSTLVGVNPIALSAADFNADGILDLVVANQDSNDVSYLQGTGTGSFVDEARLQFDGTYPIALRAIDLNGDGYTDIVAHLRNGSSGSTAGSIEVLRGDGRGRFLPSRAHGVGTHATAFAVADFNIDGNLDVAAANASTLPTLSFLHGSASGSLIGLRLKTSTPPADIRVVDFDGSGTDDFLVLNDAEVTPYLTTRRGALRPQPPATLPAGSAAMHVADVNRDDTLDIIIDNPDAERVLIVRGAGRGRVEPSIGFRTGTRPLLIGTADIAANGWSDIVVAHRERGGSGDPRSNLMLIRGDTHGALRAPRVAQINAPSYTATVADLNGDGNLDMFGTTHNDRLTSRLGNGNGGFLPERVSTTTALPGAMTADDFNEDGILDVVTADDLGGQLTGFRGTGDGSFISNTSIPTGSGPIAITSGDFDEDGHADLFVALREDNQVATLRGRGTGHFDDPVPITSIAVAGVAAMQAAHIDTAIDAGGHLDVAVFTSSTIRVAIGDGKGGFSGFESSTLGNATTDFEFADLDGDGHLDLVLGKNASHVAWVFGDGTGRFIDQQTASTGHRSRTVTVTDINLDGLPDIVAADVDYPRVTVLLGDGAGRFRLENSFGARVAAGTLQAGDFDNDGADDLLLAGGLSPEAAIVRNTVLDPWACRAGNVNTGSGTRLDLLFVNDSMGGPLRETVVDSNRAIEVFLRQPPEPTAQRRYYVGMWQGRPAESTVVQLPDRTGLSCFQPLRLQPRYARPLFVAAGGRKLHPQLDPPGRGATGSPMPGVVLRLPPSMLAPGLTLTAQGLVRDGNAAGPRLASVTNAVIVHTE